MLMIRLARVGARKQPYYRIVVIDNGIPVAGNLPLLGDLFKTKSDHMRRVELLIMMTPRVIRRSSQIEQITRVIRSQLHTR